MKEKKLQTLSQALKDNLKRRKKSAKRNKNNKDMKNRTLKITLFLVFIFSLISCNKSLENTGYLVNKSKLDLIKVNKTSKQEVIDILGEPTTKSSFAPKAYYYMERQYKQVAFFTPKLKKQNIISIKFDKKGIVNDVKVYAKSDAKSLSYDAEKITFEGNKFGVFKQVLENVGKFSSQAQQGSVK